MIRRLRSLLLPSFTIALALAAWFAFAPGVHGAPEGTAASADGKKGKSDERSLRVNPRPTRTKEPRSEKAPAAKSPERAPAKPKESGRRSTTDDPQAARAQEAADAGRFDEARQMLAGIDPTHLSAEKSDDAAFLTARLTEDGTKQADALRAYLKDFAKGSHRRDATLTLARVHYVQGDYAECDRLLAIFSPGVEHDRVGREALVLRGLALLASGDAPGALQFFNSCEKDLRGSAEEEPYYFATSQAALRSAKPQAAVAALRVLLERHAEGAYAPQALYAMGMALEQMGRASDGTSVFRQVAQRFPGSYEATRVRDRGIRPGQTIATGLPIGGGYAVQVGAFSRRDLADALARDLRLAGVSDVSVKQGNESPSIYRVRAGAFVTRDEARALGERLRRERGFSYTVVPH